MSEDRDGDGPAQGTGRPGRRRLTLRQRLAVAAGLAVAVAVALASVAAYLAVDARLRADIDDSLRERAAAVAERPARALAPAPGALDPRGRGGRGPGRGRAQRGLDDIDPEPLIERIREVPGAAVFVQLLAADGSTLQAAGSPALEVDERGLAVAAGDAPAYLADRTLAGGPARVITAPIVPGLAVQVARPTTEADRLLAGLGRVLALVTAAGALLAAGLGWWIAGRALRPVGEFTRSTEDIAAAGDVRRRLPADGDDELGRLAASFNTTLDALEESVESRRRLVADASHELRTPLAGLRTNIEVLQRGTGLDEAQRDEILGDLVAQTEELTAIVGDVVDAARGSEAGEAQEVRLDAIAEAMVSRLRRTAPHLDVRADLEPWVVQGSPERLARLVANLLDNAAKWSPRGAPVEVTLAGGVLSVRDHGPGIAPEDLPHVFDRFYRADAARGMPGSGLGLAIARQAAETHGGSIAAASAPGGGALLTARLPGEPPGSEEQPAGR